MNENSTFRGKNRICAVLRREKNLISNGAERYILLHPSPCMHTLWLETSLYYKYPIESKVYYVIKIRILAEAYLKPNRRSTIDFFCKNSWWLKIANYFRKKAPSQMFGCVLNTLLTCTRDVEFLKKL